ncbi:hypothetical protein HanIR_Chr03g0122421 [Helianthus annuus]|nr:hypothetical protein HanIR_Chr03g0122421 [Helianthus annuus]
MDPYNPNNPNSSSHPFSSSGYTPVMDNAFAGYQQMPNAFNQMMKDKIRKKWSGGV